METFFLLISSGLVCDMIWLLMVLEILNTKFMIMQRRKDSNMRSIKRCFVVGISKTKKKIIIKWKWKLKIKRNNKERERKRERVRECIETMCVYDIIALEYILRNSLLWTRSFWRFSFFFFCVSLVYIYIFIVLFKLKWECKIEDWIERRTTQFTFFLRDNYAETKKLTQKDLLKKRIYMYKEILLLWEHKQIKYKFLDDHFW